jgi:hypothetical protein
MITKAEENAAQIRPQVHPVLSSSRAVCVMRWRRFTWCASSPMSRRCPVVPGAGGCFIREKSRVLNIPTVAGVSGVVRITKSASPRRSTIRYGVARSAIPGGRSVTRGSMPSTRIPSAACSFDASPPAPPTPTISTVFPGDRSFQDPAAIPSAAGSGRSGGRSEEPVGALPSITVIALLPLCSAGAAWGT